jgi:predicted anti-sigma-YlaC factor YlaD
MDEAMNCQETEQLILDALETPLSALERESVDKHCSHCSTCAQFATVQAELDHRLRQFITAPALSTDFQGLLMARLRQRPRAALPAWSPDVAYGIGALVALIAGTIVLPFKPETVLTLGAAICMAAYLFQSFIFVFVNEPDGE